MTQAVETPITTYAPGGASVGPFATGWTYAAPGEVQVVIRADAGETVLTQGADYSLTPLGGDSLANGGQVQIAPAAIGAAWAGRVLAVLRQTPAGQSADLQDTAGFRPSTAEDAFDKLTRLAQEARAAAGRAVNAPYGEAGFALPPISVRAGRLALFSSAAGAPLVAASLTEAQFLSDVASVLLARTQAMASAAQAATSAGQSAQYLAYMLSIQSGLGIRFFKTFALATAAVGGLTSGQPVGVFIDESRGGLETRYVVEAGALVFVANAGSGGGSPFVTPQGFGAIGDGALHLITAGDITAHPGWIGTYTAGVTSWDFVGLQEAIYAAYARASTPGAVVWNNFDDQLNRRLFIPSGDYILANSTGILLVAQGFHIECEARKAATLVWSGADVPAFVFDSVAYGHFDGLTISAGRYMTAELVSFDGTGAHGGLKGQQFTVNGLTIFGNRAARYGVMINRVGGSSGQHDTILFENCFISGCNRAAVYQNGQNALSITWLGGDIQDCPHDGISVIGGSTFIQDMSFQNQNRGHNVTPALGHIPCMGADLQVYSGAGASTASSMKNIRSEGDVLVLAEGGEVVCGSARTAAASALNWFPSFPYQLGLVVAGGSSGDLFLVVSNSALTEWFVPNAGLIANTLSKTGAGWTINAFAGKTLAFRFGGGPTYNEIPIVSNTADTITLGVTLNFQAHAAILVQVQGETAGSAPAFDGAAMARRISHPGAGQGFTLVAGSTTIAHGSDVTAAMGDFVCIPDGDCMNPGGPEDHDWPIPYFARVTAVGVGSFTVNRPPRKSKAAARGYIGAPLVDGDVRYLRVPFLAARGASLSDCSLARGYVQKCEILDSQFGLGVRALENTSLDLSPGGRISMTRARRLSRIYTNLGAGAALDLTGPLDRSDLIPFSPGENVTLNAPAPPPGYKQEFTLVVTTNGTTSYDITFGANFKSAGVLSTGTVNAKKFVVRFVADGVSWNEVSRTGAM